MKIQARTHTDERLIKSQKKKKKKNIQNKITKDEVVFFANQEKKKRREEKFSLIEIISITAERRTSDNRRLESNDKVKKMKQNMKVKDEIIDRRERYVRIDILDITRAKQDNFGLKSNSVIDFPIIIHHHQ